MPFVEVHHLEGAFDRAQQEGLIRDITDAIVKVGGEGIRPNVVVVIHEVRDGLWGHGGEPLTIELVNSRRAGRNRAATSPPKD
jgi:4-oxalocrotonate tautomerase family enzyme